jgi:Flp pilus assembly protein CpaB
MKFVRMVIIATAVLTAGLAGAVMMGTADARKTATY